MSKGSYTFLKPSLRHIQAFLINFHYLCPISETPFIVGPPLGSKKKSIKKNLFERSKAGTNKRETTNGMVGWWQQIYDTPFQNVFQR